MSQYFKIVLAALCVMVAIMLAPPSYAAQATITGEVTYRERIALPEGGRLVVRLVDVSKADAPARIEAEAVIAGEGQVPLQFTLNFDPKVVNPKHSYALVAEIRAGNVLWFRNTTQFPVDPLNPAKPLVIVVNFIGQQIAEPKPEATIFGIVWRVTALGDTPWPAGVDATLSIAEDGRAGGKGGCNNYFAQSRVDGQTLDFSAIASTRMACAPQATKLETAYFAALDDVKTFLIDKDNLFLIDANGNKAATLTKAEVTAKK